MDSALKPVSKQTLLFMGSALGISFVTTHSFDFLAGLIANIVIFVGAIFYIRRKQKIKPVRIYKI